MSFDAWIVFALFWVVFVTTPGPNAVNCISNGMNLGFRRATALLTASPTAFFVAKLFGAGFLIYLGVRGLLMAGKPVVIKPMPAASVYWRAFAIATINPKSVAGYLAAFSQFVQPEVPIWDQMLVIVPTALVLTTFSYTGYTALGAGLGRAALGAVFNVWFRRGMAIFFIFYGVLLGASTTPAGRV